MLIPSHPSRLPDHTDEVPDRTELLNEDELSGGQPGLLTGAREIQLRGRHGTARQTGATPASSKQVKGR